MQTGRVYKHRNQWMFRYRVATFVDGEKVWKDAYKSLAPLDKYETAAQVEKEFARTLAELRGAHSASFTQSTTQSLSNFIENVYFPKQTAVLKPSTLFGYRHLYNRHIKPLLDGESMRDFKMSTAQRLLDKVAAQTPLSSTSLKHVKWFLKAVFDVARKDEAYDPLLANPFAELDIPKASRQKQPTRYATLDQILDMVDALPEPAATVVATAAFSGLRKSEIQGLKWEDLKGGELHVQRSAWRTTAVQDTKTEASKGAVPVISILAEHLEAHRNGFPNQGFIFIGPKMGKPLDLHNLANRIIRPALKTAKIAWCGWHGFRRGLATNLHTLGVADTDVQRILRHSDVRVTQESYIKVEDSVKRAAMNKLQKALLAKRRNRKHK